MIIIILYYFVFVLKRWTSTVKLNETLFKNNIALCVIYFNELVHE